MDLPSYSLVFLQVGELIEYVDLSVVLALFAVILITVLFYWMFYVPFDWTKHMNDVSYTEVLKSENLSNGAHKRDAINRLRKARKIGSTELPPPFPNGWYGIMESSNLKAGEVKYTSCLGEHFVVYRTATNEVFILDAYCPHLGANLGIGGRVVGDSIECPFHQWRFGGTDGKCTHIPYSTSVPQGSKVRKWTSQEFNDFIFVWYHADTAEKPWDLVASVNKMNKDFVFHGRNEFYVNCHIQEIPENGADLAHFGAIHNESIFAGSLTPKTSMLSRFGYHLWSASWSSSKGPEKHIAEVTLSHKLEIFKNLYCFQMDVSGKQIGPSYVNLALYSPTLGHFRILQTIIPVEPLMQKVVHRFYGPRWMGPLMKIFIFGESVMFERDMNMWNHKVYRKNPLLVKEDMSLKQFRLWFAQFYENSKSYPEVTNVGW
ncbi:cholesterol 7-desaturase nvd [Drosophila tropicalis]|uniref:cholesterol 7-desaturase nvd n=1 Tax=Drosophila tropicalis TaxID=46794 RepID=UPI0035AC2862